MAKFQRRCSTITSISQYCALLLVRWLPLGIIFDSPLLDPKLSLFEIPATAFAPLSNDPRPITERDLQAVRIRILSKWLTHDKMQHPVLPAKQCSLELSCAPGALAVVAPPRGLGALVCETRVLLFDFAIPPVDEEGEEDE